jgi:hypothetical protein
MMFVEEPGQVTTPGRQNDQGKAPALATEVSSPYEAQSKEGKRPFLGDLLQSILGVIPEKFLA